MVPKYIDYISCRHKPPLISNERLCTYTYIRYAHCTILAYSNLFVNQPQVANEFLSQVALHAVIRQYMECQQSRVSALRLCTTKIYYKYMDKEKLNLFLFIILLYSIVLAASSSLLLASLLIVLYYQLYTCHSISSKVYSLSFSTTQNIYLKYLRRG